MCAEGMQVAVSQLEMGRFVLADAKIRLLNWYCKKVTDFKTLYKGAALHTDASVSRACMGNKSTGGKRFGAMCVMGDH